MITPILIMSLLSSPSVFDRCDEREAAGKMLFQVLDASKVCKSSKFVEGWTDCTFTAGGTVIELVGAIGPNTVERAKGLLGAGWYIKSVDKKKNKVRVYLGPDDMPSVRVDAADIHDKERGCIYDTAYITLDSSVSRVPK